MLLQGGCGDSDPSAGGAGRARSPRPVRDTCSAPTLTEGQIVPSPIIATQRNHVVEVGVTDLEPFVTGDDQLISVSVGLVTDLSILHLRDAAICNCVNGTRYRPDSHRSWLPASLLFPDPASGSTRGSGVPTSGTACFSGTQEGHGRDTGGAREGHGRGRGRDTRGTRGGT